MACEILGSRLALFIVNGLTLIFGCVLIFYGTVGYIRMGKEKTVGHVTNAFALVISMGTLTLLVSLFGLVGSCCARPPKLDEEGNPIEMKNWKKYSNRILMMYFTIIMIIAACLLYASLLCFIWSDKAVEYTTTYSDILEQVLGGTSFDSKALGDAMKKSSAAAGGFCLLAIFLNLLCAHCSAMLMGYKYTARKTVVFINMTGFVIGTATVIIAFMPSTKEVGVKNSWLPSVVGSFGVLLMFFAIIGGYAAFRLKSSLLLLNGICLSAISIIFFSFGIFCLVDAKDAASLLSSQLYAIKSRFVDVCPGCCTAVDSPKSVYCSQPPSYSTPLYNFTNGTTASWDVKGTVYCCYQLGAVDFQDCCQKKAGLLVWNNLSLLGVTCTISFIAILMNLIGSFYLYRKIRRELAEEVMKGELDGLEGGDFTDENVSRSHKYRAQEPDDDL